MADILLSGKTIKVTKDYNLTANELAFVDLVACGWDRKDAFFIAMNTGKTWARTTIENVCREILARAGSKQRMRDLKAADMTKEQHNLTDEEVMNALSKESMLKDLYEARQKMVRGSKEWLDTNRMIADITRMKQEEIKTEDQTVHFYLPITCHRCSLYVKNKENS